MNMPEAIEYLIWSSTNSPKAYSLNREYISDLVEALEKAEEKYQSERKENEFIKA